MPPLTLCAPDRASAVTALSRADDAFAARRAAPDISPWLATELQDELLVATNDLDRLQRLLAEAGDTLAAHFCAAGRELQAVQGSESNRAPAAASARALEHLGSAVTSMQFQDLATQLIAHCNQRLRGCAQRLARHALSDGDDEPEPAALRPNPVAQDEMNAGPIELF